jgi:hypothetical protein
MLTAAMFVPGATFAEGQQNLQDRYRNCVPVATSCQVARSLCLAFRLLTMTRYPSNFGSPIQPGWLGGWSATSASWGSCRSASAACTAPARGLRSGAAPGRRRALHAARAKSGSRPRILHIDPDPHRGNLSTLFVARSCSSCPARRKSVSRSSGYDLSHSRARGDNDMAKSTR